MEDHARGRWPYAALLVPILVGLMAGSGVYLWQHSMVASEQAENVRLRESCGADVEHSAQRTQDSLSRCQAQLRQAEEELSVLRQFSAENSDAANTDLLPVYGPDRRFDPDHLEKAFYVAVPTDLPLLQKLRLLASKMSWYRFDRLPIEVLRIEDLNGKQIAVVNLAEEGPMYSRHSWSGQYFQGSTGGQITQESLVQTFLQKDYPGEWIDGVRFYYRGEPFRDEWDHIRMVGTFYRDGSRDLTRPS